MRKKLVALHFDLMYHIGYAAKHDDPTLLAAYVVLARAIVNILALTGPSDFDSLAKERFLVTVIDPSQPDDR